VLAGFKREKVVHLYAAGETEAPRFVHAYPVLAASGQLGPKLAEGDRQVPEGIYRIESLNPNSRFHLSLRLDYPNQFDRARAQEEGRQELGGDIMIDGAASSIGCLAIGDPAIEELFVLVADVGRENVSVILSPVDLRTVKS
jgi:murein L,D-transpeptidase YafK